MSRGPGELAPRSLFGQVSSKEVSMARVVMEQTFDRPLTDEEHARVAQRLDGCLDLRRGAWVRSYLAADRKRMVCEFDAPDAESVRQAVRSAGLASDRVWTADVYAVEDYPEHLEKLQRVRAARGA
jgi:hypothetical protein